jgi:hypothetical protein
MTPSDLTTLRDRVAGLTGADMAQGPVPPEFWDAAGRALIKEHRRLYPRSGWPALPEARRLAQAALSALATLNTTEQS